MKGGFTTTKEVERVEKYILSEIFMRGNGKTIFHMAKEYLKCLVVLSQKDSSSMVIYTGWESIHIQIKTNMTENSFTENKMVKEQGYMQMAANMKANGRTVCEMAKVRILRLKDKL